MLLTAILPPDQEHALHSIRAAVGRLWARPLHRYFTDHGVVHSERIIALLDGLTAGMMRTTNRLEPVEAFVLLAAAYLHDIGMQDERFAGGDLEVIRAGHHEQTAEMIYRVFEEPGRAFSLPLGDDPGLVEAIALVAQGQRRVDLAAPEYEPFPLAGSTVHPRLLAALLRFADELDIDYRRVDLEQMKVMNLPLESQLHWWKCHYVGGVTILDEYIRIAYRFPHDRPDYQDLLIPLIEGEIRAMHGDLEPIFRRSSVKVAMDKPQVRFMRLVRPMPMEVEALARQAAGMERTGELARQDSSEPKAGRRNSEVGEFGSRESGTEKPGSGQPAPPKIDFDNPPIALIRVLLTGAFTAETLKRFCMDRPLFRPVVNSFGPGHGLADMVDRLIEYCETNLLWDQLLAGVKDVSPGRYERFMSSLRKQGAASHADVPGT